MDWNKIKAEYIAGGTSYRKLAEKYGITLAVLRNVAEREEWVKLKAQAQHKANTKIVDAVSNKEAKKATDIVDVADKLLEKIFEILDEGTIHTTQSVKNLTSALKDLKDIKGYKSAIDLREQEARIDKLRKEAERDNDTTNEIEVVFKVGEEAWNE